MAPKMIEESPMMLVALGFMITASTSIIYTASRGVYAKTMSAIRAFNSQARSGKNKKDKSKLQLKHDGVESIGFWDALKFPLHGSCVLFGLYLAIKYIPKEWLQIGLKGYLTMVSIAGMAAAARPYLGASIPIGLACIGVGAAYLYTGHWVLNNVMAVALSVLATELLHFSNMSVACMLLVGLFFYDIFWVFGTDVMVTVAKNVQGPIKLLFPHDILGDHEKKSLLGLGDIVIPGIFIMQVLRMSLLRSNGKSTYYFKVMMAAYVLSLLNTMGFMVFFEAAQPALLYIVPWLLVSLAGAAALRGEVSEVLQFDQDAFQEHLLKTVEEQEAAAKQTSAVRRAKKREASASVERVSSSSSSDDDDGEHEEKPKPEEPTMAQEVKQGFLALFGQDDEYLAMLKKQAEKLEKKKRQAETLKKNKKKA